MLHPGADLDRVKPPEPEKIVKVYENNRPYSRWRYYECMHGRERDYIAKYVWVRQFVFTNIFANNAMRVAVPAFARSMDVISLLVKLVD